MMVHPDAPPQPAVAGEAVVPAGYLLELLSPLHHATDLTAFKRTVAAARRIIDGTPAERLQVPDATETKHLSRRFALDALDQLLRCRTLERATHYFERLQRAAAVARHNGDNDLDLNRWKEYGDIQTDSLWIIPRRDNTGVHTAGYWGNYIPQIPNQMIRRYTRKGGWVLDAFAGMGTTLIEAQRLGRNCLGVELQPDVAERANALLEAERRPGVVAHVQTGDSSRVDFEALLRDHGGSSADLVMLHPPYHDIIRFSDDPRCLSNAATVEGFVQGFTNIAERITPVIRKGGHACVVIGDKYSRGEWIPLGFLLMNAMTELGYVLKSIVVKNFEETTGKRNQSELWRYRALAGGFFVFKHEYLLVLRNP